jgi:hypothetical protein
MKLKKERFLQIIKEELFYRDFYRASELTVLREQPELEMMPPEEKGNRPSMATAMREMPPPEEKLTQQQKLVSRGVETGKFGLDEGVYEQMIMTILMSEKVTPPVRKAVFVKLFGSRVGMEKYNEVNAAIRARAAESRPAGPR